jgi:hypothetical protein
VTDQVYRDVRSGKVRTFASEAEAEANLRAIDAAIKLLNENDYTVLDLLGRPIK